MNKFYCITALVCLTSLTAGSPPSGWNTKSSSSGWTTESSLRSGWNNQKAEVKSSDSWKQPAARDNSQGWVSSENAEDLRPKSIPTSWQKVQKQSSDWVKSSGSGWDDNKKSNNGWDNSALNPPSQEIAKGLIVKHPLPTVKLSGWTQSAEEWQKPKSSSGWDTKSAQSNAWQKDSSAAASGWQQSAPGFADADAASARLSKQAALSAWQKKEASTSGWEKKSASNGWEKDASSQQPWQKESAAPAWNDVPAGWEKEAAAANSGWQKDAAANSGWDADADFKAWQKETAANGWEKESSARNAPASSGWDDKKNDWQSASRVYNDKKSRGPAPSKWQK